MELPICETCPCFVLESEAHPHCGECHLNPHVISKLGCDFCSHHPDFKAYIASLMPPESTGNSVLDKLMKTIEKY